MNSAVMPLPVGTCLGPYRLLSLLGSGGMSEVYKAIDTRLNRSVAVKLLHPRLADQSEFLQRFDREAHAISRLNHPNICTLYDVGHVDGRSYLVMEYLSGETLASRLSRSRMNMDEVLAYAIQTASALKEAHSYGIIHRDLKPANILITRWGVKLMDFGIAKIQQEAQDEQLTWKPRSSQSESSRASQLLSTVRGWFQAGSNTATTRGLTNRAIGTLPYMSPEQLLGKATDWRTDIFSFGSVLYEMGTGRRAFRGLSDEAVMDAILKTAPPPASSSQPLATDDFDRVIETCLSKDPCGRQSAGDLLKELTWITTDVRSQTLRKAAAILGAKTARSSGETFLNDVVSTGMTQVPRLNTVNSRLLPITIAFILLSLLMSMGLDSLRPNEKRTHVFRNRRLVVGEIVYKDEDAIQESYRLGDVEILIRQGLAIRVASADRAETKRLMTSTGDVVISDRLDVRIIGGPHRGFVGIAIP